MNEGDPPAGRRRRPAASGPGQAEPTPAEPAAEPAAEQAPAESTQAEPAAIHDDARGAGQQAPRFRRRSLDLGDGTSLVLNPSGSIDHVDGAGAIVETWTTADPGWDRHAIRFGLRPQEPTVAPTRRGLGALRAPRW